MSTQTPDQEAYAARRAKMMEKVKKLLAMGRDERGNPNEVEAAMRQANKLMAEFDIEEAEVDLVALKNNTMKFGELHAGPDGMPPQPGKVCRQMPRWVDIISIGVGRFTDAVVSQRETANGRTLIFRGEKESVLMARWLLAVFIQGVEVELHHSGWTKLGEKEDFRLGAASVLQKRLYKLAEERMQMYRDSTSRALMVVDLKKNEVVTRYGEQLTSKGRPQAVTGANLAGRDAGQRINIPTGKPIAGQAESKRIT